MARKREIKEKNVFKTKRLRTRSDYRKQYNLLKLPRELRDLIWIELLSSTRLTFGAPAKKKKAETQLVPNSLAFLRISKQINQETKDLWLKLVLFNFLEGEILLDKLAPLPLSILSQIRHVRLSNWLMRLPVPGMVFDVVYRPVALFMLLPGLQLDRFTVLADRCSGGIYYDALQSLIEKGNGWRELHFITQDSNMLGFGKYRVPHGSCGYNEYRRQPQPSVWTEKLYVSGCV